MSATALSAKTQQVFDLMQQDVPINDIAERLNVTPQAIYQHRKKLIDAGLIAGRTRTHKKPGRAPALSNGDGKQLANGAEPKPATPVSPFLAAKLAEVDDELARLDAEADQVGKRLAEIDDERQAVTRVREALASL